MPSPSLLSLFTGRGRRAVDTITPARTFADVILPPETRRTLGEALAQVRNHALIFDRWGLGERHATGLGLAFNFAGPLGTGKTIGCVTLSCRTWREGEPKGRRASGVTAGQAGANVVISRHVAKRSCRIVRYSEALSRWRRGRNRLQTRANAQRNR